MSRRSDGETGGAGRPAPRRGNADAKSRRRARHRGPPVPKAPASDEPAAKADADANLDDALDATFPASDPVAAPHVD